MQLTSLYKISCFCYCEHYLLFYKTSYPNEEVNCTEHSPSMMKLSICLFFRVGTYSSGPLPTPSSSQPPSLGIPPSPAVPPPPTGPPLFPLSNYPPEPSMKTSSQVSSQPLTSGSGVLSYPHSAAMTRLASTRRRHVCCQWFKPGACITKLYDRK